MPPVLQRWLPVALVVAFALGLRTWDLDRRPMHADEANQAIKTGDLLEGRGYAFDPVDHHGPTLYYAALPLAWLRGEHTLPELTETTLRLGPALAGTAAVLLLYFLALPLGRWPALAAAAFLAVSPPSVYYNRYFVQESLLVAFTLGTLLCARRWWRGGGLRWAIATGVCVGLMQATKASTPFLLLAAAGGLLVVRPARPATLRPGRDLPAALLAALLIAGLFYTSFGTNPRGLLDAMLTYPATWSRLGAGTGHEKPWWYYLSLLGWQRQGGLVFHQAGFSLLALAGLGVACFTRPHPLLRWAAGSTVLLLILLSATAYKTPWHLVQVVPSLALLAAGAVAAVYDRRAEPASRLVAAGLAAALIMQMQQVRLTSFRRPADERNPYAYVHTSTDALKVRALVVAAQTREPGQPVRIISEEVWPLPWYLRGLPDIGYWNSVPSVCDGALVIASASMAEDVRLRMHLHNDYEASFVGLRPGFTLVVFTRRP